MNTSSFSKAGIYDSYSLIFYFFLKSTLMLLLLFNFTCDSAEEIIQLYIWFETLNESDVFDMQIVTI